MSGHSYDEIQHGLLGGGAAHCSVNSLQQRPFDKGSRADPEYFYLLPPGGGYHIIVRMRIHIIAKKRREVIGSQF